MRSTLLLFVSLVTCMGNLSAMPEDAAGYINVTNNCADEAYSPKAMVTITGKATTEKKYISCTNGDYPKDAFKTFPLLLKYYADCKYSITSKFDPTSNYLPTTCDIDHDDNVTFSPTDSNSDGKIICQCTVTKQK